MKIMALQKVIESDTDKKVYTFDELGIGTIFVRIIVLKGVEKYAFQPSIKVSKRFAQSFGYTGKDKYEGREKCRLVKRIEMIQTDVTA